MSKETLSIDQFHFIDEVAYLLVPWGMPPAAARLYGYLLLRQGPVSLDQISLDLEISKSSASVAARLLEQCMLIRRHGERGSKRALYGATNNFAGLFTERSRLLGAMGNLLQSKVSEVAAGEAEERLQDMSGLFLSMQKAMEDTVRNHSKKVADEKTKE